MPSKFGGVAVQPKGSAFGGIPAGSRVAMTPQGDRIMLPRQQDLNALQAQGRAAAAQDMGPLDALTVAAGKKSTDIIEGAQDLANIPGALIGGPGSQDALVMKDRADMMARSNELYQPLSDAFPVVTTIGEAVPYFAAPVKLPGLSNIASNTIIPGLIGGLEYGTPMERGERAAVAAAGGLLASSIPRMMGGRPYGADADPYLRLTSEKGEQLGFKALPSVRAGGDRALQIKEAGLESAGRTNEYISGIRDGNVRTLTKVAAKEIGLDADRLTPDRLQQAREAIGAEFDRIGKGKEIALDQQFYDDLDGIVAKYSEGAGRRSNKVANVVKDLKEMGRKFFLTPDEYKRQTSTLVKDALSLQDKDGAKAEALLDARAALDSAFDRSVPDELADLKAARDKWRTMLMVEQAVNEAGDVSFPKLANVVKRKDQWGYMRGNKESPLYDALRYFKAFPENFGRSGTAERGLQPSLYDDVRKGATSGAILGGALEMGGGIQGATALGGLLGGGVGAMKPITERAGAALYTSQALNRGLLSPAAKRAIAKSRKLGPLTIPGLDLQSEAGQGLLGRSLSRVITPGFLSIPQAKK